MKGAMFVAGTASDAGKSVLVAGICRWLARQGIKVAPFKAQNMALNSYVTLDGAEIGRAQAMQAAAAGVEPEAAMNPVLLKPSSDRRAQVIVQGRAVTEEDAASYHRRKATLLPVVLDALEDLRARFDVVICEGAGSPAEINLREGDIANMGVARAARLPTIVVGDIDRGGVFAALYGTLALLDAPDAALVRAFVINKFRGDPAILAPGLAQLHTRTGRPVLGVLPHAEDLDLDGEDSLARPSQDSSSAPVGRDGLDVAVLALPRLSNYTDMDPLRCEPGVSVRFTSSPGDVARADLVVVPGTKATVADLEWLRARGLAAALCERARLGGPILGICGGYQMLGAHIHDDVESGAGHVHGLGLLPVTTRFADEKVLRRVAGTSARFGSASGYEIRHGRVRVDDHDRVRMHDHEPLLHDDRGDAEGCVAGNVIGTSWHGLLEEDAFRRAFLGWVAGWRDADFVPGDVSFAAVREARAERLAAMVEAHLDTAALAGLIAQGALA